MSDPEIVVRDFESELEFFAEDSEEIPSLGTISTTAPETTAAAGTSEALDLFFDAAERKVEPKPWMKDKKFILGTVENLARIMDECIASKRFSLDLETSGLDNRVLQMPDGSSRTVDRIAGVCMSPDGITGYYIPLHHVKIVNGQREEITANVPIHVFDKEFRRVIEAVERGETICTFHNAKFDQEFLQYNETGKPWGEWDKPATWHCTMILNYMRNPRARVKKLKIISKSAPDADENSQAGGPGLGMEMIELHELWGHEKPQKGFRYDFTTLDPTNIEVLWYACSDAICTYLLLDVLGPPVLNPDTDGQSMKTLYTIEKLCVASTRWMERNRIHINRQKVEELIFLGQKEWYDSVTEVYKAASEMLGRDVMPPLYHTMLGAFVSNNPRNLLPAQMQLADSQNKSYKPGIFTKDSKEWPSTYDVEAPQQLGKMFQEMGVQGLKLTAASEQVKTDKKEIERIIEEEGERFPFMGKIRKFREVAKALSSYLYPMYLDSDPRDDTMRISFQGHKIDTGRFATPTSDSDSLDGGRAFMIGWPEINIQATPNMADTKRPACMLRIRECITARPSPVGKPPKFLVAIDYSGVELRLVTNLSREPKWLVEFFHCTGCDRKFEQEPRPPMANGQKTATPLPPPSRCPNCGSDKIGDLHTITGMAVFGADAPNGADWKALRGKAKALNFALCYGGGSGAAMRAVGVDKNEGSRIKQTFDRTYLGLSKWWKSQHAFARKHRFVRTAFGRKYPVPDINNQDGGFRSKAERNAVNGPIQGTSADITKLAMALIYKECKKRNWLDKVLMVITMHDELVFEIDADIIEEAIPFLVNIMGANDMLLAMNWPIPLTSDVEIGFGWDVPWDLNGMRFREVRFHGNKKLKGKDKCPEGVDWDTLSSWPDALRPWFKNANVPNSAPPSGGGGGAPAPTTPDPTPAPSSGEGAVATAPQTSVTANPVPSAPVTPMPATPTTKPNEVFQYRLRCSLDSKSLLVLAQVIVWSMNRGTHKLELRTRENLPLDGWLQEAGLSEVRINGSTFQGAADFALQKEGLL